MWHFWGCVTLIKHCENTLDTFHIYQLLCFFFFFRVINHKEISIWTFCTAQCSVSKVKLNVKKYLTKQVWEGAETIHSNKQDVQVLIICQQRHCSDLQKPTVMAINILPSVHVRLVSPSSWQHLVLLVIQYSWIRGLQECNIPDISQRSSTSQPPFVLPLSSQQLLEGGLQTPTSQPVSALFFN